MPFQTKAGDWRLVNPFEHNDENSNILQKSCGVHTKKFLKYVRFSTFCMHKGLPDDNG